MYQSNNSSDDNKGCNRSCCSCSCLLIVVFFILANICFIYAAYYWCWHIDNRVIEKLKNGELNSKNFSEYLVTTISDYWYPKKDSLNKQNENESKKNNNSSNDKEENNDSNNISEDIKVGNTEIIDNSSDYIEEETEDTETTYKSESSSVERVDFEEVSKLIKNNEFRKNLDVDLKNKFTNSVLKKDKENEDIDENSNDYENNNTTNLKANNKKVGKYDYLLDLPEEELLNKIGDDIEENKAILKVAIDNDYGRVLKQLLAKDSNLYKELIENKSLLFYSAEKNSVKCRNYLINNGADMQTEYQGKNLLHIAAQKGDIKLAKKCLSIGLPINKPTSIGYTPFYFSVMSGDLNMVKYLVENGAKVEKSLKYLAKSKDIYDYIDSFE